jgi:CRISPR-associated protein Csb1
MTPQQLVERLNKAVALRSNDAGIRISATLQPAGGPASKVFPPTYAKDSKDSPYVQEKRFKPTADGQTVPTETVLLDAQQSQANRVEEALMNAINDGELSLPHLRLEGVVEGWTVLVTNLTAPHRGPDAYFRDSETLDGTLFDKSAVGELLRRADAANATPFFEHVPSDLLLGFWDSQRGGRGVKVPRCYTSEIIGWDPQKGQRAAGKVDPNNIEKTEIAYPKKRPSEYVVLAADQASPKGFEKKKPSDAGHGNIPPSEQSNSGVSISGAERVAYLSFAGLNRLRFPKPGEATSNSSRDNAARTVLACLALYADRLAFNRASLLLRSGCELIVVNDQPQWLLRSGETEPFSLSVEQTAEALGLAIAQAKDQGFTWSTEPLLLRPQKRLVDLLAATFTRYAEVDG